MERNGGSETGKQRLALQARAIQVRGWLSEMEIVELKREGMLDTEGEDEDEALGQMLTVGKKNDSAIKKM